MQASPYLMPKHSQVEILSYCIPFILHLNCKSSIKSFQFVCKWVIFITKFHLRKAKEALKLFMKREYWV